MCTGETHAPPSELTLHNFHQVRHFGYHATNGSGVWTLNHLVQPGKTQPFDHQLVFDGGTNGGTHPLQVKLAGTPIRCLGHCYSSSADLPRRAATSCLFFNFFNASNPLRMAWGTSFAFPEPYPTTAALGSPTTTRAAKERFLPPLTTLVTRLMATTWSLSW